MPHPAFKVGRIELIPLLDADASFGEAIEGSFPGVPHDAWNAVKEDHPEVIEPDGTWRLRVRCTLIRAADRTILVDTGVGSLEAPASSWFSEPGRVMEELATHGVVPGDIDTVVLTHVHDDHLGGAVNADEPSFPNARYVLQEADLHALRGRAEENEEDRTILDASIVPLEVARVLDTVEGGRELVRGVTAQLVPGHTPGHQIVVVESDGVRTVISGDVFNLPVQLSEPDWFSGTDDDPALANATRRRLVDELAESGTLLAPSHFAEPIGRVMRGPDGRPAWEPLAP